MSVILDALRKLDREKSFRKNMTANIAIEILKPDLPRAEKRFPRYFATIFLTAMAAAVITYFTMVDFLPKPLPPAPVNPSAPSQGVIPAPMEFHLPSKSSVPAAVIPPTSSQQANPALVSREAVQEVQEEIKRRSLKPPTSPESKITVDSKPSETSLDEKKAKPSIIREELEIAPSPVKKSPELTTSGSSTNPPVLKLSAIVWYEEPSRRFAMINGLKAIEGSIIEGVKIVEINPTSVRFLHNDKYFEVSMAR